MKKPIVFMFSGQGSQYYQMGKELYDNHPRFKMWMDYCDEMVEPLIDTSLIDIIYDQEVTKTDPFDRLLYSNPALLCIEYSLARVLMESGIQPDYVLGYSLGEFTASVISGAVSLEEAIELTVEFAKLLEKDMPAAGMLAVIDSTDIINQHAELFAKSWVTGSNFDRNFVVSGLSQDITELMAALKAKRILHQRLPVNYGFHTQIIDPVEAQFKQLVRNIYAGDIEVATISALTGGQIDEVNQDYFWNVVRQPVDFAKTITGVLQQQDCVFIDVGPSGTLATFVKYLMPEGSQSEHFEVMNQYGKNLRSLENLETALVK
ncbi:MAG: bacillaene synthase trans-acting acyltransferase [Phenylobacterium sp.]|jgi:bacillaene synthase trans-acting acyltransferase